MNVTKVGNGVREEPACKHGRLSRVASSRRRLVVAALSQWGEGKGLRRLVATESRPPFEAPELSGVM